MEENTSLKHYFENTELHFKEDLDVIENALKDYENTKKELKLRIQQNGVLVNQIVENDKKLKAFEIIKEKEVDIHNLLISKTAEQYNGYTHWLGCKGNLTQEEFEILKEVLS